MSDETSPGPFPAPDSPIHEDLARVLAASDSDDPTAEELANVTRRLAAVLPPGALPPSLTGGPPAAAASVAKGLAAKIGIGISIGVVVASGAWVASRRSEGDATKATPLVATPGPSASMSMAPAPSLDVPPLASSGLAMPAAPTASPVQDAKGPTQRGAAPKRSESELLYDAHDALLRGAPEQALALTVEHEHAYPNGTLTQEAEVIAIEALVASRRGEEAQRRAAVFRKKYPHSGHRARIDQIVGAP